MPKSSFREEIVQENFFANLIKDNLILAYEETYYIFLSSLSTHEELYPNKILMIC